MALKIEIGRYYRDKPVSEGGHGRVYGGPGMSGPHSDGSWALPIIEGADKGSWRYFRGDGGYCGPSILDLVCEVARLAPGAPWVDVARTGIAGQVMVSYEGDPIWTDPTQEPAEPAYNCYTQGHVWVDTGMKRSWCHHCETNAEWDGRAAMFTEVSR